MTTKSLELTQYLNKNISCSCGKEHTTSLKDIIIGKNVLSKVPDLVKKYHYKKVFLISDINTFEIAGNQIKDDLEKNEISVCNFIFSEKDLIPDELALGKLLTAMEDDCDLVISVGSGTLNDLGKYISHKTHTGFFVVGTAPSMDGYASNVSPLIINHLKTTYITHIPTVIIGDLDILKEAPMIMIAAGAGDILGKYVCLIDWKIAHLIQDEYYCPYVAQMVTQSIEAIVSNIDNIKQREESSIRAIMEGLILSGIAMSFIGNSRPASGSEHHLAHYWEMMFLFKKKPTILHGIKVGLGTVTAAKMYKNLSRRILNIKSSREKASNFDFTLWENNIRNAYLSGSETVLEFEKKVGKNSLDNIEKRLPLIEENWNSILDLLKENLPSTETLMTLLKKCDAPDSPAKAGITKEEFHNGVLYAKDIRNRYGLLQLLFDLGLNEEICLETEEYFYIEKS